LFDKGAGQSYNVFMMTTSHKRTAMLKEIKKFDNQFRFLSNFSFSPVELDGEIYPTVEAAYQAAKTLNLRERKAIRLAGTPNLAKRLGRRVTLRSNWEKIKRRVMTALVRRKFTKHAELRSLLLNTGDAHLEEGNWWGDVVWGVCNGKGTNWLGQILMKVRAELREGIDDE
jgi:ribA/ribD-fused uncharacterized protein